MFCLSPFFLLSLFSFFQVQYARDIKTKEMELKQVQGYIQQTMQKIRSSGRTLDPTNPTAGVDPRALHYYQGTKSHLDAIQFHAEMLEMLEENDLGNQLEYFPLLAECFRSPVINEKKLKGGMY